MKMKSVIVGSFICAGLMAVSGCKKEQPTTDTTATKAGEGATSAATKAADTATKATETATTAAKQAADQAATQAQAAQQQAQGLIDRAKSLVGESKYQEALTSLGQLKNLQLTAEQQKIVDDLKAKIQAALGKAATTDPASALGGALGGGK